MRIHRISSQRLDAAVASTTVHAGDKRSFSHCLFCGANAAVAPNRPLNETFGSFVPFRHITHYPIFNYY